MHPTLKQIKRELKAIAKQENLKVKHSKNSYQDMLSYVDYFAINRKKHYLNIEFVLQKQEKSISWQYRYEFHNREKDIDESYVLSQDKSGVFPGIDDADVRRVKKIYDYKAVDGHLENQVPLDVQALTLIDAFKNNYKTMIDYAKRLSD